jgi:FkbM family methyltransferase
MSITTPAPSSAPPVLAPAHSRPPDTPARRLLRVGWRLVRDLVGRTAGPAFVRAYASPSRFVRTVVFDAAQRSSKLELLLYTGGTEHYVLNSRDDMICRSVFVYGEFDLAKLEQTRSILRARLGIDALDTIIDVGANIGTICIPAVLRGYASRAIAVEPHPLNCRILRTNVALNGLHERITVFECACGADRESTAEILRPGNNWGDVRVVSAAEARTLPQSQRCVVASRRLDDLVEAATTGRTVLWIDTQGFEVAVLQGAAALLARRVPLVVEFDPALLAGRSGGVEALAQSVAGYRCFVDLEQPQQERPAVEICRLAAEMAASGRVFTDILIM